VRTSPDADESAKNVSIGCTTELIQREISYLKDYNFGEPYRFRGLLPLPQLESLLARGWLDRTMAGFRGAEGSGVRTAERLADLASFFS